MNTWHYMKNGAQAGPVTTDELRALLAGGLASDTMIWREGLSGWQPANTVPEFGGIARTVPPPAPGALTSAEDVEKNKVFAVLCYLPPLLFLVSLIVARNSKFAMYHCNQAIVLCVAAFACGIVNMLLGMVLLFIPVIGWIIMSLLHFGLFVGVIVLVVMGLINAANGVCKPLPLIGHRFTIVK